MAKSINFFWNRKYSTVIEMLSIGFFALFLVGSLMLILGIFLLIYSIFNNREKVPQQKQKSKTSSSGIIMIGPIPIVFGYSKWFYIIPIAAIVTIFLILLLLGCYPVIASKGYSSLGRCLTPVFLCIFASSCCSCCSSRMGDFAFFPSGKISHLLRNASGCVKISTL